MNHYVYELIVDANMYNKCKFYFIFGRGVQIKFDQMKVDYQALDLMGTDARGRPGLWVKMKLVNGLKGHSQPIPSNLTYNVGVSFNLAEHSQQLKKVINY